MSRVGWILALGCSAILFVSATVSAATATRSVFGTMPDGRKVDAVMLRNSHGVHVRVIAYGARVQSVVTPDRHGHDADIALGYASLAGYLSKPQYFGATVGRFANRIAGGRFTLRGKTYQIPVNDGPNALHGGPKGFSTRLWTILSVKSSAQRASVTFQYVSPNGDMGFPGKLTATATYTLEADNRLRIDLRATTDAPTIVNLTNHTYWNLSGEGSGSVMPDLLTIHANAITPTDTTQIPTGAIVPVAGSPFDFRHPKPIGKDILDAHAKLGKQLVLARGYDMNFVVSRKSTKQPRVVARVCDPASGRVLTLSSNQPGVQFYSGNFLNGTTVGTGGHIYRQGDAFVLEAQRFPDAPNHPNFGSAELDPGQTYHNVIIYQFTTRTAANGVCAR